MRKRERSGFTLIEMLVSIVIIVLLVSGIGVGIDAGVRAYNESAFESDSAILSDILTNAISDVLRYSRNVSGSKEETIFTNYDYNVKDAHFDYDRPDPDSNEGYIIMKPVEGQNVYLVNSGAYTDDMVVCDLEIDPHEVKNEHNSSYYFTVKYSLKSTKHPELSHDYQFRVRQANADITAVFETDGSSIGSQVEKEFDVESITVVYDSNTDYVVKKYEVYDIEQNVLSTFFGVKQKSITQIVYLPVGTSFRTVSNDEVECSWYELIGWGVDKNNDTVDILPGQVYDLSYEQQKEIIENQDSIFTLYAKWQEKSFPITYNANTGRIGESESSSDSYTYSTRKVKLNTVPVKDHWTFDGWLIEGKVYKNGETVELGSISADALAQWRCKVTYDSNGGSAVSEKSFCYGDSTVPIDAITKKGYTFKGWSAENGGKVFASQAEAAEYVNKNGSCTFYAKWEPIKYNVMFYGNGSTGNQESYAQQFTYDKEEPLAQSEFERIYTISFDAKKGSSVSEKHEEWTFKGWATSAGGAVVYSPEQSVKNLTSDNGGEVNLYAVWETGRVTMPISTRSNWTLDGWNDGTNTYLTGNNVSFGKNVALNAKWSCIVTYDANEGEGGGKVTYTDGIGFGSTMSDPTRTGYTFLGWTSEKDGDLVTVVDHAKSHGNCTVYAKWEIHKWTIYMQTDDSTATVTVTLGSISYETKNEVKTISAEYNSTVTVSASDADGGIDYVSVSTDKMKDGNGTVYYNEDFSNGGSDDFTMPDSDVYIYVDGAAPGACLTGDTLITMADGSQKMIRDIKPGEKVLVFNHETGRTDTAPMDLIVHYGSQKKSVKVLHLLFSDGTEIKVIKYHGFFDLTTNEYVYIKPDNYRSYYGHEYYSMTAPGNRTKFVKAYFTTEMTDYYAPITKKHLNYFANGVLAMTSSMEGLFNIFELDDYMMYDKAKMQADIQKYGLYTYDDFKAYIPYEIYDYFPAPYLKASVGKGYITFEHIIELAKEYCYEALS